MIEVQPLTEDNSLLLVRADSQHNISSSFIRVQEYYECQGPLRRKVFTMEEYMDWYAEENGHFTYLTDWAGYNVPGNIFNDFFKKFKDLRPKEKELQKAIKKARKGRTGKFYVIGVYESPNVAGYIDHEICHGLWYLDPKFQKRSRKLLAALPKKAKKLMDWYVLDECKYHPEQRLDECNAYWSTNTMTQFEDTLETDDLPWKRILKLQRNFQNAKEEYGILKDE